MAELGLKAKENDLRIWKPAQGNFQDAGGTVLKTSLDDSKEKALREALAKAAAAEPEAAIPG
jgi:hypothetical protein